MMLSAVYLFLWILLSFLFSVLHVFHANLCEKRAWTPQLSKTKTEIKREKLRNSSFLVPMQ